MSTEVDSGPKPSWYRLIAGFERVIVFALIFMLMVIVALASVELGWLLIRDLTTVRQMLLDAEETFALFGSFLLVLIGLELLTTLKTFILAGVVQVEVVVEVALIAIAQKIIILDTSRAGPMTLIGLSAMVLALAATFWMIRRRT